MILENCWNITEQYQIKLCNKAIIFGINDENKFFKYINYFTHLAKWYISKHVDFERNKTFFAS